MAGNGYMERGVKGMGGRQGVKTQEINSKSNRGRRGQTAPFVVSQDYLAVLPVNCGCGVQTEYQELGQLFYVTDVHRNMQVSPCAASLGYKTSWTRKQAAIHGHTYDY